MRKYFFIFFILAVLVSVSFASSRELKNNFYYNIPAESAKCFNMNLPSDIGVYEDDRVTVNVTTDAETNIKFIEIATSPQNPVVVPLCFFSFNRKAGGFSNYTILLDSEKSNQEIIRGGFCVSESKDTATGIPKHNVCDFIIKDEKIFDVFFQYGDRTPMQKGKIGKMPVRLYSQNKMDIELSVESSLDIEPKNYLVHLDPRKAQTVEFEAAPEKSGNYPIKITAEAVINGEKCDSEKIPFCKRQIEGTVVVDSIGLQGWHFYVTPQSYSTFSNKPIPYTAVVENHDEEREFQVELKLPEGLRSGFTTASIKLGPGGKKEFNIEIIPEVAAPQEFEIQFFARADVEKIINSQLSFRDTEKSINGYWSDIRDNVSPDLRPVVEAELRSFLSDYRENGIELNEYGEILDLLEKAEAGQPVLIKQQNITETKGAKKIQPFSPYFILVPIIIILAFVFVLFYKRSRNSAEDEF